MRSHNIPSCERKSKIYSYYASFKITYERKSKENRKFHNIPSCERKSHNIPSCERKSKIYSYYASFKITITITNYHTDTKLSLSLTITPIHKKM